MDATGVSHIAVCVRDLDKSLAFYRDILGMRVTFDEVQDTTTGGLPHIYKHPRQTRRTVHVRYGEGHTIPSLVLTSHPGDSPDGDPIQLDQIGISHLSFIVDDLDVVADELMAKGVQIAGDLQDFCDEQGNMRTFFVYDPDHILVQFESAD